MCGDLCLGLAALYVNQVANAVGRIFFFNVMRFTRTAFLLGTPAPHQQQRVRERCVVEPDEVDNKTMIMKVEMKRKKLTSLLQSDLSTSNSSRGSTGAQTPVQF